MQQNGSKTGLISAYNKKKNFLNVHGYLIAIEFVL